MLRLEVNREAIVALERDRTAGTAQDIEAERGRHALALTSALSKLERHLSPEQRTKARLLTQVLARDHALSRTGHSLV